MLGHSTSPADRSAFGKLVILIAEDEPLIRFVITDFLSDAGYSVVEAANAEDALAVIASGTPVDLVFTDINMPGAMNGFSLAEWLSSNRPQIPVILTSGALKPVIDSNMRRFVPKPYELGDVEKQIRALLP